MLFHKSEKYQDFEKITEVINKLGRFGFNLSLDMRRSNAFTAAIGFYLTFSGGGVNA